MTEQLSRINWDVIARRYTLTSEVMNLPPVELTGLLIANTLLKRRDSHMLFDMDGVVLNEKNWDVPEVFPQVIESLQRLEQIGVDLGIATARGQHIRNHLREHHQLQFLDHKILEGGRLMITREFSDRASIYSCYENQELANNFVVKLEQSALLNPYFYNSHRNLPEHRFCLPPEQWRRMTQASFWYRHDQSIDDPSEQILFLEAIKPLVSACAKELNISEEAVEFQVNQSSNGLTYTLISLKANRQVTKATHLADNSSPVIYFADGDKDLPLAEYINKSPHGFVIAVMSDLGESKRHEVESFRKESIVTLSGPDDLARALHYACDYLSN